MSQEGEILAVDDHSSTLYRFDISALSAPPDVLDTADTDAVVHTLAFSPDDRYLAGVSTDGEMLLWNAKTMAGPAVHYDTVTDLAIHPSEEWMVTADWEGVLTRRSTDDFGSVSKIETYCAGNVYGLAFSHDGELLVASCDHEIRLWKDAEDVGDNPSYTTLAEPNASHVVFDPHDAARIAVGQSDGSITFRNIEDRAAQHVTRENCTSFGVDWAQRFLGSDSGATDAVKALIPHEGHWAAFADDGEIWFHDPASTSPPDCESNYLGGRVCQVALSPNGEWLASIVSDADLGPSMSVQSLKNEGDGVALPYDAVTVELCPGSIAFHPARVRLAGGIGNRLQVWEPGGQNTNEGNQWIARNGIDLPDPLYSVAYSPDGSWLAAGGGRRRVQGFIWIQRQDRPEAPIILNIPEASVDRLGFDPKGMKLAAASTEGSVRIWNLATPNLPPLVFSDPEVFLSDPTFNADGTKLAALTDNGEVRVFSISTQALALAVCRTVSSNLSWGDWNRFIGTGEPYERTCLQQPVHPSLLQAGDELVLSGNVDSALAIFRRVAEIQPDMGLEPKNRIAAIQLRERVLKAVQPKLDLLSSALREWEPLEEEIREQSIAPIPFKKVVQLCRWAALLGEPQEALVVCDQGVEMLPGDVLVHDSRGIARALTGNLQGAAEDFQHTIGYLDSDTWSDRGRWAQALQSGENPLTPEVVQRIVNDEILP